MNVCSVCERKANRSVAVKRCPHCSQYFCHGCLLRVHKPAIAPSAATSSGSRPGLRARAVGTDEAGDAHTVLTPAAERAGGMSMSGALAYEKMPRRGVYFRALVLLFWLMVALNLYLVWTAVDVDAVALALVSWLVGAHPPLTLADDHANPVAALLSFGLVAALLLFAVLFELNQADLAINDVVDTDSFRAWEVGALYTRPYLLQLSATARPIATASPSTPRRTFIDSPAHSPRAASSSSSLSSSSSSSSSSLSSVVPPSSPSTLSPLASSGSFWALHGAPTSSVFDVWIGETTPRMPDGDDLESMALVEIQRFVMKGPSALALRFDESPPLYQWNGLTVDHAADSADCNHTLLQQVVIVPNGVWWIGVANRSETHRLDVRINMRPIWTSPQSWVLPLEGREYACDIE